MTEALLRRFYGGGWAARLPFARPRVHRVALSLSTPHLPAGFGALRIGFASDLHAGPTTARETLEQAFALLRDFRPHLLLLGGDYVLFEARHARELASPLRSIEAPLGRYAVLGNHDLWAGGDEIAWTLEKAGVHVLVNQTVQAAGAGFLSVGGLDDSWAGRPCVPSAFEAARPLHLLLMHSPDQASTLDGRRFTAAFAGHTHGGHIALPGGWPLVMPSKLGRRYCAGRYELPGGPLWVSRGVGNVELPLRAFAPPDVLCLTLAPAASTAAAASAA